MLCRRRQAFQGSALHWADSATLFDEPEWNGHMVEGMDLTACATAHGSTSLQSGHFRLSTTSIHFFKPSRQPSPSEG